MSKLPKISGKVWFNTRLLTEKDLAGKVVLVDFWTYSCVNCLRTLPFLSRWWEKYKDRDFFIIGIHTPEFEFEKEAKNVGRELWELGVDWPVVLDNDYANWHLFDNHYWPAKYLFNKSGDLVYTHFGEGNYTETERAIQELLKGGSETKELMPQPELETHTHGAVCFSATPELYCGYKRGILSNPEGYKKDEQRRYETPKVKKDSIGLEGGFVAMPEYVESTEEGATLYLNFNGTEVNLVAGPANGETEVSIMFGGQQLDRIIAGPEIKESFREPKPGEKEEDKPRPGLLKIKSARMYNLIKSDKMIEGILSITVEKGNFRAYAFTFSGCEK